MRACGWNICILCIGCESRTMFQQCTYIRWIIYHVVGYTIYGMLTCCFIVRLHFNSPAGWRQAGMNLHQSIIKLPKGIMFGMPSVTTVGRLVCWFRSVGRTRSRYWSRSALDIVWSEQWQKTTRNKMGRALDERLNNTLHVTCYSLHAFV